jgi:hypothetical protein
MVMCVWRGATARRRRSRHLLYESSFRRLHAHASNYFLQWRAIVGTCLSLSMLTASCECLTSSLAERRHRSLARGAGSSGHVAGATRVGAVYTLLPGAAYLSRDNVSHRSSSRRCIDPMACVTVLLYCGVVSQRWMHYCTLSASFAITAKQGLVLLKRRHARLAAGACAVRCCVPAACYLCLQ